jgi:hypothetical protein
MELKRKRGPRKAPRCSGPVWDIPSWTAGLGIGYSTYFTLDPKPEHVTLGKNLVRIVESPADYARRVGKAAA